MQITLDNLQFDFFIKILYKNFAFDVKIESIYCKSEKIKILKYNIARLKKYILFKIYFLESTTLYLLFNILLLVEL